ncbi:MAG: hypothetical protein ACRDVF_01610 [Microbacterium sp.]|uniref:hypothetical protein n=1 Tax=Microbacterium sp. TaxID=51671 RepID=UPI003D6EF9A2
MQNNHPGIDLAELDSILGSVLAYSNGSAERRLLALLCKGISNKVPDEAIRLWVDIRCVDGYMFRSTSDAVGGRHGSNETRGLSRSRLNRDIACEMRSLAKSKGWAKLVASARERVLSSSGDGRDSRDASLDIALRIVAGVLMQFPEAPKPRGSRSRRMDDKPAPKPRPVRIERSSVARAALMTMGLRILSEEPVWETVPATQPWLAAELGLDVQVIPRALDLLEERRLITRPSRGSGVPTRSRVVELGKRKKAAQVWMDVATQLQLDGESGPVAAVLRSVTHPAWTYSDKLGARHWLVLLADVAGVKPSVVGVTAQMAAKLRADLADTRYDWSPAVMVPYLDGILDRLADDIEYGITDKVTTERVTARVAKERAMAAYEKRKAERAAEAKAATKRKRDGHAALGALLEVHPVPKSPFDKNVSRKTRDGRQTASLAWADAVHRLILSESPNETAREIVGELLIKRLVKGGYPQAFAEGVVNYIMQAGDDVTLEEWMYRLYDGDRLFTRSLRRG